MNALYHYKKQYHEKATVGLIELLLSDTARLSNLLVDAKENAESDTVRVLARSIHGAVIAMLCVANQLEVISNINAELDALSTENIEADFNNPKETT